MALADVLTMGPSPYAQAIKAVTAARETATDEQGEEQPSKYMAAIQWISDKFSRGNYLTANLARPLFGKGPARLINPVFPKPEERFTIGDLIGGTEWGKKHPYMALPVRVATDIVTDPIFGPWTGGPGSLTNLGKGARLMEQAAKSGVTGYDDVIKMLTKAAEATPIYRPFKTWERFANIAAVRAAEKAGITKLAPTWAQQAKGGERALVSWGLPFAKHQIPGTAKIAEKVFEKGAAIAKPIQRGLFKAGLGLHVGDAALDKLQDTLWYARQEGEVGVEQKLAPLLKAGKSLDQAGLDMLNRAMVGQEATPEIKAIADKLHEFLGEAAAVDVPAGRLAPGQVAKYTKEGAEGATESIYEASQLTKRGQDIIESAYGGGRGGGIGRPTFGETIGKHAMKRMRQPGESVVDANIRWRQWLTDNPEFAKAAGVKPKEIPSLKIFEEDPIKRVAARLVKTEHAEANRKFINSVVNETAMGRISDIRNTKLVREAMFNNPGGTLLIRAEDWKKALRAEKQMPMKWATPKLRNLEAAAGKVAEGVELTANQEKIFALLGEQGFLDEAGNIVIRGADDFERLRELLPQYAFFRKGKIPGAIISQDAKLVIDRLNEVRHNPTGLWGAIERFNDKVLGYWKPYILASGGAGYLSRNMQSDEFMNFTADALTTKGAVEGSRAVYRAMRGKPMPYVTLWGEKMADIVPWLQRQGVIGSKAGFVRAELGQTPELASKVGKAIMAPARKFSEIRGLTEDIGRATHFFSRLEKGDSLVDAVQSVDKYLHAYGRRAPVEAQIFRNIMPFGFWYRRNIPNQIRGILQQPAKYGATFKSLSALEKTMLKEPPNAEFMADYLQDELAVGVRETKNQETGEPQYEYVLAGRWLPVGDLIRLIPWTAKGGLKNKVLGALGKVGSEITQQVGGPYKTAIEAMLNYSTFTRQPIEKYPGEMGKIAGVLPAGRRLQHVVEGAVIPPVRMFSRFGEAKRKGAGNYGAAINALLGAKTYRYDPARSKEWTLTNLGRLRSQLRHDLAVAQKGGDERVAAKLEARIAEVESETQRVKASK